MSQVARNTSESLQPDCARELLQQQVSQVGNLQLNFGLMESCRAEVTQHCRPPDSSKVLSGPLELNPVTSTL